MGGQEFGELIGALRRGQEWAYRMVWRDLNPAVVRYLRRSAREHGDDIAAETWLAVAKGIGDFEGDEADFRAWVFTIARHRLIDWRRRQARRPVRSVGDEVLIDLAADANVAETAIADLEFERLRGALDALSERQAEIVLLAVVADLDSQQIADVLGIRPSTVRVHLHRGLRRLAVLVTPADTADSNEIDEVRR